MQIDLTQKAAIVTGSDSGIGRGIAMKLAASGAAVVVNYAHNQAKAEEVRQAIEQSGGTAFVIQADVSQIQQVYNLVQQTVDHFHRLDIMVNNAGMEIHAPFVDVTEEMFDRVVSIDLKGAFFGTQAAAREMIKEKVAGRIINISSVHEELPMPQNVPYVCAKGGVRMLTRTVALELAPYNITINNIAPGAIETPIDADVFANQERYKALLAEIPMHRLGQPVEVGDLAVYLASDYASYITGTTFTIDGGLSINTGAL